RSFDLGSCVSDLHAGRDLGSTASRSMKWPSRMLVRLGFTFVGGCSDNPATLQLIKSISNTPGGRQPADPDRPEFGRTSGRFGRSRTGPRDRQSVLAGSG